VLKPKLDITILKRLLRVVVFNMPFKKKLVQVIVGDHKEGYMPEQHELDQTAVALAEMSKRDQKNFGDTVFLTTHSLLKFRPFSIEKLRSKIMFVVVGDQDHPVDDVAFKKIELEVKAAFESAKLSTQRVVVLKYPVELVEGDVSEEKDDEQVRKPGVDTTAPK